MFYESFIFNDPTLGHKDAITHSITRFNGSFLWLLLDLTRSTTRHLTFEREKPSNQEKRKRLEQFFEFDLGWEKTLFELCVSAWNFFSGVSGLETFGVWIKIIVAWLILTKNKQTVSDTVFHFKIEENVFAKFPGELLVQTLCIRGQKEVWVSTITAVPMSLTAALWTGNMWSCQKKFQF